MASLEDAGGVVNMVEDARRCGAQKGGGGLCRIVPPGGEKGGGGYFLFFNKGNSLVHFCLILFLLMMVEKKFGLCSVFPPLWVFFMYRFGLLKKNRISSMYRGSVSI